MMNVLVSVAVPFLWLGVFLFVAAIINRWRKRPAVNGALWFMWVFAALLLVATGWLMTGDRVPGDPNAVVTILLAMYLPAFVAAVLLSRRFRRRQREHAARSSR